MIIIVFNLYRISQKPFLNITEILHHQLLRGKKSIFDPKIVIMIINYYKK